MKSTKVSSATCDPIMMFGGSPISVAVPPMLLAITSTRTSGTAEIPSTSASRSVMGTISRMAVRLSRKAERSPVTPASRKTRRSVLPPESWATRSAM
jgi:hypothetical protein